MLKIPKLKAAADRLDAALASHLQSDAAAADLSVHDVYGDKDMEHEEHQSAQMLLNMLHPRFAVLTAQKANGELLQGRAFSQALMESARAMGDDSAEVHKHVVFVRVDLAMLRAAAAGAASVQPSQAPAKASRRPRP